MNIKRFALLSSVVGLVPLLAASTAFAQASPPAPVISQPPGAIAPAPGPAPVASAPDAATPPPAEPEPLMWRGTSFTWTQGVTTTTVGIGRDNYGYEDDYYGWDFTFSPNLFVLDLPEDKITVFADVGVSVEWTDSGSTTTENEPQFRDMQVGAGYTRSIWKSEDKEWSTGLGTRVRYNIPTSNASLGQGRYGVLSLGTSLTQKLRLLGNEAKGLNNLTVVGGFTWSHLFARSYTPTNPDLERTRQSASGATIFSDQLSFRSMDIDRLIPSVTFVLPLIGDLSLTTGFRLIGRFRHDFEGNDCEIVVAGECQQADRLEDRATYFTDSSFDLALTQPIYDFVSLNLGYNNESLTLGEDGKNRNVFYSPGAQFYLDLTANLDVIYAKASGREEVALPPGPRNNSVTALNEFGQPSF